MDISEISPHEALRRLETGDATFIDVRDLGSYLGGHIPGAQHVGDHNIADFVASSDRTRTVVVYCYHGNSSRGGAAHLQQHGFEDVYSMSGGFTAWPPNPIETGEASLHRPKPTPKPAARAVDAQRIRTEPSAPQQRRSVRRRLLRAIKRLLVG